MSKSVSWEEMYPEQHPTKTAATTYVYKNNFAGPEVEAYQNLYAGESLLALARWCNGTLDERTQTVFLWGKDFQVYACPAYAWIVRRRDGFHVVGDGEFRSTHTLLDGVIRHG